MENINPSEEQNNVIEILSKGLNCFVNAVPGAGKSTLSYLISNNFQNFNVLSLTYSASLKREARIKIQQYNIENLEIHSYHSFAIEYYNENFDDSVIERVVEENKRLNKIDKIDLLILDEIQDMTINIYNMVMKYISDSENNIQLLVIGDKDQAIFSFVDADHRFLTLADKIFPGNFAKAFLSRSYRLTDPVSQFINQCMLGESKILTSKPGKNVQYVIGNPYFRDFKNYIYKCIEDKIKNGYSYEDIFILAPSVKGDKTPIKRLNQFLAQQKIYGRNIPIYINTNDEESLTDEHLKNKIVMTTFHQSKGRERKLVILMGFDESYYKFTQTEYDPENPICPNPLYVAPSRPTEELIIIHSFQSGSAKYQNRKLPFFRMSIEELDNSEFCDVKIIGEELYKMGKQKLFNMLEWEDYVIKNDEKHTFSVTELTTYLSESFISETNLWLKKIFKLTNIKNKSINIKNSIKNDEMRTTENVSDVNGIIIPAMWEMDNNGICSIYKEIKNYRNTSNFVSNLFKEEYNKINWPCETIADYLHLGNMYMSVRQGLQTNLNQIDPNNEWLTKTQINVCKDNLDKYVNKENIEFEKKLGDYEGIFTHVHKEFGKIELKGVIDAINDDTIYEFKCTQELLAEHKLQLVLYAWIWKHSGMERDYGKKDFKLMNIITGEIYEMEREWWIIDQIVDKILCNKLKDKVDLSDDEFISQCLDG
jgi:hypothetical protein